MSENTFSFCKLTGKEKTSLIFGIILILSLFLFVNAYAGQEKKAERNGAKISGTVVYYFNANYGDKPDTVARRTVNSFEVLQYGIALVNQDDFGSKIVFDEGRELTFMTDMPPDKAKKLMSNIGVLIIGIPHLYLAEGYHPISDPMKDVKQVSYADNGNGTITDNVTGLMWQKGANATAYNWYQASGTYDATNNPTSQKVCGSLALGGQYDWRLPTKKELITIIDYSIPYPGPTINTTYFPNTSADAYWSSTTFAFRTDVAWYVYFGHGVVNYYPSKSNYYYVRCVRGGQ